MRQRCVVGAGRRVAVIGIDGFSPVYLDRLLRQGKLPAIGRLARKGVQARVVSTLPATTPVAWATMTTGAPPSTTGIEGFLIHQPGDELDRRVSGCYSYRCRAQTLWDATTRAAKRAFVVKFPLSYPSSTATFRLDGAAGWGGLKCLHEVASRSIEATDAASGKLHLVQHVSDRPSPGNREGRLAGQWIWYIPTLWAERDVVLHLAMRESPDGRLTVDISEGPDGENLLASLQQGDWSAPLTIRAAGRRGPAEVCFRVKVLSCSAEPPSIRVLNTALHERLGHSSPDALWQHYVGSVGPIEEQTEPSLVFESGLDVATQLQLFGLNVEWLRRVSMLILTEEDWDLFLVHVHIVDWAHHLLHGGIDPRHPDFDSATAPGYEQALTAAYRLADDLVAAVAKAAGLEADVVVVGDHGQDLQHTTFRPNEWLAGQGLLHWSDDGTTVDWSRTRAFAMGNYIHLNRLGREPTGLLTSREADKICDTVVDGLLSISDSSTGSRPILIAGDKQLFEQLGANGAGVGDIVFCMRSGYQATNGRGQLLSKTRLLREFTSGHDHFWPLDPRIHTRLFAAGPSFRQGGTSRRLAQMTDVTPTICAALAIDPPEQCEGRALNELLVSPVQGGPSPEAATTAGRR
jgi:predicted AlkP superfamily phosphohydrolase/phosphomutase